MFIDDECENLILIYDGGEITRNISQNEAAPRWGALWCEHQV